MKIDVIQEDKHEVELQIDNITVAEALRTYLYESGASFAAWRREHPSKPAIMKIRSEDKTVSKVVADAVAQLSKDCKALVSGLKK